MAFLAGCADMPVGNRAVPQPARDVDIKAYAGLWYEIGRYENRFERDCEAVTASYSLSDDGRIDITNSCRSGGLDGREKVAHGKAKVVPDSGNAKLKVSFFGPFYVGNYWVLDHAPDYSWSIVGEPSGRYLWILSRVAHPDPATRAMIDTRVRQLGYDQSLIRPTLQP
ncbi:lipocalin family protein [Asticcacaulis sp. EMRT-3]|nr:lipocalin family protein [Asticcacaulis sp. EMRT-3]MDI7775650.1 lipocalin family protein [Asticcacaulis sp. EMRT-3]